MASKKRKSDGDSAAPKPAKQESSDRDSKRQKRSENRPDKTAEAEQPSERKSAKSVLRAEEKSFPRGGADILTPLERKKIHHQAVQDVLFEQSTGTRDANDGLSDDEGQPPQEDGERKHKKAKSSKKKKTEAIDDDEPKVRVEGLNFKRLVPGSIVLGQISQITSRDISLALPNNLTGYIALTSISDHFTANLEKILASDNEDGSDDDDFDNVDPKDFFRIGQFLRAYVETADREESSSTKKRIDLSIHPSLANSGVNPSDLVANSIVQASVVSVEDHGMVMSVGLGDTNTKAFLPSAELGQDLDVNSVREGAVLLCLVTSSIGGALRLSADLTMAADISKTVLKLPPSVNSLLPGTAVEILVTDVSATDLTGKIMGMVDATADHIHSGNSTTSGPMDERHKIGSKVKGRILFTFPKDISERIGVSLLSDVLSFSSSISSTGPLDLLPLSSTVQEAIVTKVESKLGLFLDVGVLKYPAFAHITRLSDNKVESLLASSKYAVGTKHAARVTGFNPMDGVFLVSLQESVLEQPFLRIEDITVGSMVKGKVEKLVTTDRGIGGVLVKLAEGIVGYVREMHLSDVQLKHPERKFREGQAVTARVLSSNAEKRQLRLSLKKSLVNTDVEPWTSYEQISVGDQSPGTIVNIMDSGAVVRFYGDVRAFLPVREMSEAYIKNPADHFKVGQVVNVHVTKVDPNEGKMEVSCKDPLAFGEEQQKAFNALTLGQMVTGAVTGLMSDMIHLELGGGIKAMLNIEHLTDGSQKKNASAMKKISVSNRIQDLVVLEKLTRTHSVVLSNKPSLIKAAKVGALITSFANVREGTKVDGFVRNISGDNVFVQFAGGVVGLMHRSGLSEDLANAYTEGLPTFGLRIGQSISATVTKTFPENQRFFLSMVDRREHTADKTAQSSVDLVLKDAVDGISTRIEELTLGKLTKVVVRSVKKTQLNVLLASNVQGRVDMSEAFDSWEDIEDKKNALATKYTAGSTIPVKIIGIHDARTHRFLPFSHRKGSNSVYELSARKVNASNEGAEVDMLTLDKMQAGSTYTAFINNHSERGLFVNLSPLVRARIDIMELTNDISLLADIEANFPVGSAIKVTVKSIDHENSRLELTARSGNNDNMLSFRDLKVGSLLPARVTKATERYLMVQINENIAGQVPLTELSDDFSEANPTGHDKNHIIRVCVVSVDAPNKKAVFSTRPSQVLSSSLPVKDRHIPNAQALKVNDIVRGFVSNVAETGIFVKLGPDATAFVKIANLSDSYLKDWKASFEIDQLVTGKVIALNSTDNRVQMSLKSSHVDKDYVAPLMWDEMRKGQIITGKIRKVEDFGVFIVIDNSANVSGLCHKSEIADSKVHNVKSLYEEGDQVKAIVLKVEKEKRRLSLGLKASYFNKRDGGEDSDEDVRMDDLQIELEESEEDDDSEGGVDLNAVKDFEEEIASETSEMEVDRLDVETSNTGSALKTGGFNWDGELQHSGDEAGHGVSDDEDDQPKKKKKRKAEIQIDRTGDLDKYGPQSVADYERQLLGEPNSSALWIQYMAFQLKLHEIEKARDIAERALRTIHMSEQEEKMNVWLAWLNLENSFGSEEAAESVFEQACQYSDKQEIHERLASIYIESGKHEVSWQVEVVNGPRLTRTQKADDLFKRMSKIKELTQRPSFWLNYATFLLTTLDKPTEARSLLQRATQSLHSSEHRLLTAKFGLLEFHSPHGDPERGRTVFEGLLSTWPKRWDLWDMWVDAEMKLAQESESPPAAGGQPREGGSRDSVRSLLERMTQGKMKPKRAKYVFKRWVEWEDKMGDGKQKERVVLMAREWVEKHEAEKSG